ncbi:ATP-grasp domain-containing protein [Lutibacter agarilyticus]|uniref:ATP-grasp domain-containing protein n=1 Tax=Lutibacter agarilyticus TaxID=1109740 RepID=A0A238WZQ3_9FLAO|nr:ATP-grasp domain-containing protein [Lutibacter agarilyticus]SNR51932.1 ATP-grasp domain-containing protein [Lutibacter agarilyticus]
MGAFKFNKWEYWPSYLFYVPNIPYAIYLALRAKNFVFFSATNPAIKHSGNGSESKFSTIQLIPEAFKPVSIFIKTKDKISNTLLQVAKNNLKYPVIIKPDIGFRGLLVKKINSENELISYLEKHHELDLIIQEFIDFKNECGIFYHRIPSEKKGKITSITLKRYLTIKGDGKSSLKELIKNDKRAKLYISLLTELHKNKLNTVLKKDEIKTLNSIGNHSKGTQFINGNHLISSELENGIDSIYKQIPNWFYGRLDLKYNTFEELVQLKNFKIIEINGIISEPTHIYDPEKISYFKALKEIRKHWKIMFQIANLNHTKFNIEYDKLSDFTNSLKQLKRYTRKIQKQSLKQ